MQFLLDFHHVDSQVPTLEDFYMHFHDQWHEILYFMHGDAVYSVEGRDYRLAPGDLILVRRGEAHHLQLRSLSRYERMYAHFSLPGGLDLDGTLLAPFLDRPLGKWNHYRASQFPGNRWGFYLKQMALHPDPRQQLCYLLPLLNDLCADFEEMKTQGSLGQKNQAAAVIQYINQHLCEDLSLGALAERFFISKNHLNRVFKQVTGATVWEYITVKRLFLAREQINAGEPPTRVYLKCGFREYTTFYRAYRQKFGIAPKFEGLQDQEQGNG